VGGTGQKGQEAGKGNRTLSQGQVISLFGMIIVEMGADQAGGKPAKMLFVIDQSENFLGGGVAEVVPVAEGGGWEFLQYFFPEIVRGNFAGILAAFQAKANVQGCGLFPDPEKNLLHPGPGLGKSFFHGADDINFFPHELPGADFSGHGQDFQFLRAAAGSGRADVENDQLGANLGRCLQRFLSVALGEAAGGLARIGKFVGVGMGAKHFHRDRTEIVQNLDLRGSGLAVRGNDSGPEAVAGVVAEFDRGKTKGGGFVEELRAIRHAVGVPAGGEGKVLHARHFPREDGEGRDQV